MSGANNSRPADGVTGYECLAGYYCPEGSGQGVKCLAGTYSSGLGLENATECVDCTPGSYCDVDGKSQGGDLAGPGTVVKARDSRG